MGIHRIRHLFAVFILVVFSVVAPVLAEVAGGYSNIASTTYVKNLTSDLEQTAKSAKQVADGAAAAVAQNWGKVPVKQDGEQKGTVQIWVE